MPLIAEAVSFSYPACLTPAVRDVSLRLERGEFVLLLGANGSGKSTLVRLLSGLYLPDAGRVTVDGAPTHLLAQRRALRAKLGLVFQQPENQIVAQTVADEVAFGLENANLPPEQISRRVEETLACVGLSQLAQRAPETLSGGQLQRLALAGALAPGPRYLFVDEPFAWLDAAGQDTLWAALQQARDQGCAVVLVSQEADLIPRVERVWLMRRGALVADAASDQIQAAPQRMAAAGLLAPPLPRLYLRLKDALSLQTPFWSVAHAHAQLRPSLGAPARHAPPPLGPPPLNPLLELDGVGFDHDRRLRPPAWLLREASLALERGGWLVLGGPSGGGKSSLVQLFNGLLRPLAGDIRLAGRSLLGQPTARLCRRVGLVFQNPRQQFFAHTACEELGYALRQRGAAPAEVNARIEAVCATLGFSEALLERAPQQLSGGEQLKLALGSVLVLEPEILVLDETLAALDPVAREQTLNLLGALQRDGLTLATVTHRLGHFPQFSRYAWLEGGRLHSAAPEALPDAVLPELARLSRLLLGRSLFSVETLAEALLRLRG